MKIFSNIESKHSAAVSKSSSLWNWNRKAKAGAGGNWTTEGD